MSVPSNTIKCRFCNWMTRKQGFGSNPEKAFARLMKHVEDCHPEQYGQIEAMRKVGAQRERDELERFNGTE